MIMRRLHDRAPVILFGLMLFVGISLAASATTAVTESQMRAFVDERLAMAGVMVVGAGAGLVAWVLGHDRSVRKDAMENDRQTQREQFKVIGDAVAAVARSVDALAKAMKEHDESPGAHRAASEHNHGPMIEQSERIEAKLDEVSERLHDLIRDHDRIQREEGEICAALRSRDPLRSPHPRRGTDPLDFDGRPRRGQP